MVQFKCLLCGSTILQEVTITVRVKRHLAMIPSPDQVQEYTDVTENSGGQIDQFECAKCGAVITDEHGKTIQDYVALHAVLAEQQPLQLGPAPVLGTKWEVLVACTAATDKEDIQRLGHAAGMKTDKVIDWGKGRDVLFFVSDKATADRLEEVFLEMEFVKEVNVSELDDEDDDE